MRELSFLHRYKAAATPGLRPLLLLHGTGGDESDLLPLGRALAPSAALLSPRGKVLENGMPRFFRRIAEGAFDEADLARRADELAVFIAEAREAYGIAAPIALGFSNGASIAAALLYREPDMLAGAVLLRAMTPFRDAKPASLPGTPVLVLSGLMDPIVDASDASRLAESLRAAGAAIDHRTLPAGHGLTQADLAAAKECSRRQARKQARSAHDAGPLRQDIGAVHHRDHSSPPRTMRCSPKSQKGGHIMPGLSYGPPKRPSYVPAPPKPPPTSPPLVPSPIEPGDSEYTNSFGRVLVQDLLKDHTRHRQIDCCEFTYKRVRDASFRIGKPLPAYGSWTTFANLWANSYENPLFLEAPEEYRGAGGPGAVACATGGRLLNTAGVWSGRLRPGAVLQTWVFEADYARVKQGERAQARGHSFIFIGYKREAGGITGMVIADAKGPYPDENFTRGLYQVWLGCNLPYHGFSAV